MKKIVFLLVVLSALVKIPAAAQQITMSADSVTTLLCKKWVVAYSMAAGMRVDMQSGTPAMVLEFKQDKTLLISSGNDPKKTKGNWVYDAANKSIRLVVDGKRRLKVTRLQADQLEMMTVDIKEATPDDPTELTMVCKVKKE